MTMPTEPDASVFLVGPMGSGKTAVGRQLARRLGYRFLDSDTEIEERTGVDIPFIFEKEGEEGFRAREREVIDQLTRLQGVVLATGGGAILAPETRARLIERGTVVYLETSVDQQLARTRRSRRRPLLHTEDPRGRLESLMSARESLYREVATITVRTDGRKVGSVAGEIAERLRRAQAAV